MNHQASASSARALRARGHCVEGSVLPKAVKSSKLNSKKGSYPAGVGGEGHPKLDPHVDLDPSHAADDPGAEEFPRGAALA